MTAAAPTPRLDAETEAIRKDLVQTMVYSYGEHLIAEGVPMHEVYNEQEQYFRQLDCMELNELHREYAASLVTQRAD